MPRRSRPVSRRRPTAGSRRSARCRTRRRRSTSPGVLAAIRAAAAASGSPVELLAYGAVTVGSRAARRSRRSASWPMPGVVGFSDDGAPVRSAAILRQRARLRRRARPADRRPPRGRHPDRGRRGERRARRHGARAARLAGGGRGGGRRARPRDPRRRRRRRAGRAAAPHPRLDGGVRWTSSGAPRRAGLPVTCDVTPHHLALTDEWVAGRAPVRLGGVDRDGGPVARRGARRRAVRVVAARQPAAADAGRRARLPGRPRRRHGRRDRHRPRAAHRGRQGGRVRPGGERDQRHRDGARAGARRGRRRAAAARPRRSRR